MGINFNHSPALTEFERERCPVQSRRVLYVDCCIRNVSTTGGIEVKGFGMFLQVVGRRRC